MRQLATIRPIKELRPIPDADRIETAIIDGWECVVQKGQFEVGELVIYIEIDSIVPETPEFEFMRPRKFRVKTAKMRGQVSQGLVMPTSILPKNTAIADGADVTEVLGITKYDPQAAQEQELLKAAGKKKQTKLHKFMMRFKPYRWLYLKTHQKPPSGAFPSWIHKTDEERIQNMPRVVEQAATHKMEFSVTEKVDGQSATYYLKRISNRKREFGVCSRNIHLLTPDNSSYWSVARKYNIEAVLSSILGDHESVVLQGEIIGPGIQGNKYKRSDYELYAFNLIYPGHSCTTDEISRLLRPLGIQTVPMVDEAHLLSSIPDEVEYSKGKSQLLSSQRREGVVMRNMASGISFKVINPDFLLKDEE